jgi:murein DD-endopeptidase MepM/ murein hydrolase activator NlpD
VAGQKLGLVGNSGGSSEPHLHLGISRRDAEGFHRSLPMTFSKIKNGAGTVVTGVPVDGEFYS